MHTHIPTRIHTYIKTYIHIYIHTFILTYIHAYVHICVYIHTFVNKIYILGVLKIKNLKISTRRATNVHPGHDRYSWKKRRIYITIGNSTPSPHLPICLHIICMKKSSVLASFKLFCTN